MHYDDAGWASFIEVGQTVIIDLKDYDERPLDIGWQKIHDAWGGTLGFKAIHGLRGTIITVDRDDVVWTSRLKKVVVKFEDTEGVVILDGFQACHILHPSPDHVWWEQWPTKYRDHFANSLQRIADAKTYRWLGI